MTGVAGKKIVRILVIGLAVVLAAGTLAACKKDEAGQGKDYGKSEAVSVKYTERTAPVIEKATEVTPTAEKFFVANVFSDNMVLQRDEYIRIWGTSKDAAGKVVCAEFMGLKGSAEVDAEGKWLITLDGTLSACNEKGNTLKVYGAKKTVEFKDVLVGDVYMVLGQSNAALTVAEVLKGYTLAKAGYKVPFTKEQISDNDNIRILHSNTDDFAKKVSGSTTLAEDISRRKENSWLLPTENEQALESSAIGYFFAKQLVEKTGNEIPVGILECRQAATVLAAFMTPEIAEKFGADKLINNSYMADSVVGMQESRVMYTQGINPLMNFTISGIIWYQGESDAKEPLQEKYVEHFTALMEDYRGRINQNYKNFPILIMEFSPCFSKAAGPAFIDFGGVRANMGVIPSVLENSFFIPISDLWKDDLYADNLHPYGKYEVATRIVDTVMPMFYGSYAEGATLDNVSGPTYYGKEKISDKEVKLTFAGVGDGLKTGDGGAPKGIQVQTSEGWVTPEKVEFTGKSVVTVSHGTAFTAIRYHAITEETFPENINICSSSGVPMTAFKVDLE